MLRLFICCVMAAVTTTTAPSAPPPDAVRILSSPSPKNNFSLKWLQQQRKSTMAAAAVEDEGLTLASQQHGCHFEAADNCTWQGQADGFAAVTGDWIAAAKAKSERVSGPDRDARGDPQGHFLYVGGDEAKEKSYLQIYSGPQPASTKFSRCRLHFNFHARNILEDKVALFYEILPSNNPTEIMSKSRVANDSWIPISMSVGPINGPFRLMLEVWIGEQFPYHAAFDDIRLVNCSAASPAGAPTTGVRPVPEGVCSPPLTFECQPNVCLPPAKVCDLQEDCPGGSGADEKEICEEVIKWNGYCNFENGLCGWSNDSGNDLSWVLRRGHLADHTLNTSAGHYMALVSFSKTTLGHRGTLTSSTFPPPPRDHSNSNSSLYKSCQVRFYYILFGSAVGDLLLNSVELLPNSGQEKVTKLWRSEYKNKAANWQRITLTLPPITHRHYLQFVGHQGRSSFYDIAIDDVTLSPHCFTNGYKFSTCGASGARGPNQSQCTQTYKFTDLKVEVDAEGVLSGIQKWTVTEPGVYSVTVKGAGGGQGLRNRRPSRGDVLYGVFNWTAGDVIYVLVGQQGSSACSAKEKLPQQIQKLCAEISTRKRRRDINIVKNALKVATFEGGGGGGGGGATYVFKKTNGVGGAFVPLLVAAGGGGLGTIIMDGSTNPDGQSPTSSLSAVNGRGGLNGTGAGGGWNDTNRYSVYGGFSLAYGGLGGQPCREADGWLTHGGFGGGGGGCAAGGGGGGYTGGDASLNDSRGENGAGGYSYANTAVQVGTALPSVSLSSKSTTDGSVNIFPAFFGCGCDYMCVVFDVERVLHSCICPAEKKLNVDGKTCHDVINGFWSEDSQSFLTQHMMTILPVALIVAITIATAMFFLYHRYRRHAALRAQQVECPYVRDNSELQLNRLRQNAAGRVTEYNPNYEFGGSMCTIQDLKEVNRENLTLVKALGQGAFGEVYQGYLSNVPGEITDIPVAIKTLPELSSDQAEMDFLMEALIMSKFNNPNIVKFIGVCFEKLPKFIVLELLPGGDLKSFLRESRRKPEKPSLLTMRDLLMMAMDVAKGCQYLEDNHFIHRDIAARNCLLTSRDVTRIVKIADFGMARDIYRADYYRKGGKAMLPVKWMPPEAFMDGIFTSKTDVWSFGVLLWEVMSLGFMPYPGRGNQEVMQLVTSGGRLEPPPNCPGPVHQIMIQCWHSTPEERPNFSTILERLGYCLQDPHVTNATLPVFHRPPSTERDTTIMRPPDSDVCLQVHRNDIKEPQSPSSNDYLVPIPSNYSLCTEKTELQSASSLESVDRMLEMESGDGASAQAKEGVERMPSPLKPQTVPIYTGSNNWETSFSCDKGKSSGRPNVGAWAAGGGYQSVPTQDTEQLKGGGAVPRAAMATIPPPECSPARKSPPSAIARQRPNHAKKTAATGDLSELSLDPSALQSASPQYPTTQVVSYANVAVSNSEPVKSSSSIGTPSFIYGATGTAESKHEKDIKC